MFLVCRAVNHGMPYLEATRLVHENPNDVIQFVAAMEVSEERRAERFVRQYNGQGPESEIRRWFASQGIQWGR